MIVARGSADLAAMRGALAVTIGVFDGVHRGHQAVLAALRREASAAGIRSLVVTLDPHPAAVLRPGSEPPLLSTPDERCHLFAELPDAPDAVLLQRFDKGIAALTAGEFLRRVVPAAATLGRLVLGHDFRMGRDRSGGPEELTALGEQEGFRVVRVGASFDDGFPVSSSRIRALLAEGAVREAAEMLGHPYRIEGRVVSGRGVGRRLDFPTANVDIPDSRKLLPAHGVYAIRVLLPGEAERRGAVMNLGVRPTFGDGGDVKLEFHVPGFDGDLAGAWVAVEIVERIRDERRFEGPEALAAAIAADVQRARKILGEAG